MSLGKRLRLIFEMKGNAALDAAEDPAQVLNLSYEKQLEQLQDLRRAIAQVLTEEKHIDLLEQQTQAQTSQLTAQAQQALTMGREDLVFLSTPAARSSRLAQARPVRRRYRHRPAAPQQGSRRE